MGEFNSRGELPLTVHFTDDSSAVLVWDGSLSSLVVPGDYNSNGNVDAADYTIWRNTLGSQSDLRANGNNLGASAGIIDQADFIFWKSHYGETVFSGGGAGSLALVPEPASLPLVLLIMVTPFGRNRPPRRRASFVPPTALAGDDAVGVAGAKRFGAFVFRSWPNARAATARR